MECCFCKHGEAVHLEPHFPLCQTCIEVRDMLRDWGHVKHIEPRFENFVEDVLHAHGIAFKQATGPSAAVH